MRTARDFRAILGFCWVFVSEGEEKGSTMTHLLTQPQMKPKLQAALAQK